MKKGLIIAVTIVAVIALGNVILASAQGSNLPIPPAACPNGYTCPFSGTLPYRGMMGGGNYGQMHGAMMAAGGMHQQVWTAVAQKLGMTYDQLTQALQSGQTFAQLAATKGVSLDDLKQAAITAMKNSLAGLVQQGVITQAQADWMADHMDDMPMFNLGQGFGPGMMRGWQYGAPFNGAQPNAAAPNGYYGSGMMGRGMMRGW